MGLNGVDNGQIWFDNVRVPRDAMLDRCVLAWLSAAAAAAATARTVTARLGLTHLPQLVR
jgi:alkylation response protein AidB-like acyl-CoA dehydrogenase